MQETGGISEITNTLIYRGMDLEYGVIYRHSQFNFYGTQVCS